MRFPRSEHKELLDLAKASSVLQRVGCIYGRMFSVVPWLRHIFPGLTGYTDLRKASMEMHEFFERIIKHNVETYDEANERNFIDLYIKEMSLRGEESTYSSKLLAFLLYMNNY